MQEFKSKNGTSLWMFFFLTFFVFGLLYLVLFFTINFRLTQISFAGWMVITLIYLIVLYCYAGIANNDILLFDNRVEVVNRLPLFRKHIILPIACIKTIQLRHEWTETLGKTIKPEILKYILVDVLATMVFPADYKWIKFNADKEYKFYCFGIEMDYYDNEGSLFEDLFRELSDKGIKVNWTALPDNYYSSMSNNSEK